MVDYANMTEAELLTLQAEEFRTAKIAAEQAALQTSFYAARAVAVAALQESQAVAMGDLNALWSAKEANGYDVDYVPQ